MTISNEQLEKIRKINLGKILYSVDKIKDDSGVVINTHIGKCVGQIKSINIDGTCTLYNPSSRKEITMNIMELNKNITSSDFVLRKKFI